jgi:predicted pore-forming effector associated with SMODS systems
MANNIPQRQNEDAALRLLAAQRSLYGSAKIAQAVQFILVVIVPSALLVVEHFVVSFKIWAAFTGLIIAVADVGILETIKASLRRQAAAVQELFDCKVLELEWPARKVKKPDPEDVHDAASDYRSDVLKNWYPQEVGELPLYVGRIICQRSNCWWDSKLRRRYRAAVLALFAILFIGVFVAALLKNLTIGDFVVSLLAPVLPILLWCIREA